MHLYINNPPLLTICNWQPYTNEEGASIPSYPILHSRLFSAPSSPSNGNAESDDLHAPHLPKNRWPLLCLPSTSPTQKIWGSSAECILHDRLPHNSTSHNWKCSGWPSYLSCLLPWSPVPGPGKWKSGLDMVAGGLVMVFIGRQGGSSKDGDWCPPWIDWGMRWAEEKVGLESLLWSGKVHRQKDITGDEGDVAGQITSPHSISSIQRHISS